MKAIEFVATPKNGFIKIPDKYLENAQQRMKVVLIPDEKLKTTVRKKKRTTKKEKKFATFQITTKGFKFDREEANRR